MCVLSVRVECKCACACKRERGCSMWGVNCKCQVCVLSDRVNCVFRVGGSVSVKCAR